MILLTIAGFVTIGATNYFCSKAGFSNFKTGDKDILFPFSTTIFLFFSLLIYLPQVNGKIASLSSIQFHSNENQGEEQDEEFPVAFLLSLLALSLAVFIDKFCINKSQNLKKEQQRSLRNHGFSSSSESLNQQNIKQEASVLKYFLSLAILFVNLYTAYFITKQHKESYLLQQLLIIFIFSAVLNFSFGFLLAWSEIQQHLVNNLLILVNSGLLVGLILGFLMNVSSFLVILPCISVGFSIYTSVFICLPKIFTNGEKPVQDKFRYWAISTSLLLTIIYYPILYLLKI